MLAAKATERKLRVEVVDPTPLAAASRAALAVIRPNWHPQAERAAVHAGLTWYDRAGLLRADSASVTNWTLAPPHFDRGWYLVDPVETLEGASWKTADGFGGDVLVTPSPFTTAWTVDCRGEAADEPMVKTYGYTLVSLDAELGRPGLLHVHHARPYHSITLAELPAAASHPREVRVGSSSNLHQDKAQAEVLAMLVLAEKLGMVAAGALWRSVVGVRGIPSVEPKRLGTVKIHQPGHASMAGFGRFGFALAPMRADELLTTIQNSQP